MITALIAASLLMDAPRTHLDDNAHFEGRDLWAVSAPRGSRSVTIPLKRQLSGFEHARIDTEVYIPEGAGVTGVCAKVISWPAMIPIYEYDSKTVVMPVSSVDASQSGLAKVSCDIDLHAMLAAGTVPMPSRLATIELLRRDGAPAAIFGLGSSINCLGRRVTSYATRDAKEIARLLAMVPFCKVFAWCPTAAEIIV